MVQKRASKPIETVESFLFEIVSINPEYSFGVGNPRFDRGAYSEHAHTEIVTTCLAPKRFAGRTTTFVILGDRSVAAELKQPSADGRESLGVGTLTMKGDRSEYLGSLPLDALMSLAYPILGGALRYISLAGFRQRHASAIRVNYISFKREADLNDY